MATVPSHHQNFHIIQCYAKTLVKDECVWIKASSLVLKVDARNVYMNINIIYLCETISDYERKKLLLK